MTREAKPAGRRVLKDPRLHIIFGITLSAVMGVSSITPVFPKVAEALDVAPEQTGLLITFYYLSGVILTPVLGFLSDRIGRKRILVPSLFLFGVAGTACAFARDFELLLGLRLLQGMGAASLGALNLTLIGDIFAGNERTAAMGYNASVLSIGTAAYPAIGGALAMLGWHYPFALPIVAIPVGLFVLFRLDNPEPEVNAHFKEYLAQVTRGLKNRQVVGIFLVSFAVFAILFGPYLTFVPLLLDDRFAIDSFAIGLVISSASITTFLVSANLEALTRRFSATGLIYASIVLYVAAMAMLPYMPSAWWMVVPSLVYGAAQGLNIPSVQTLLAGLAPIEYRGAFMALNGTVYRIGQTTGPVAAGVLYAAWSYEGVFWGAAGLAALLVVVVAATLRE
ncbi:MFS transporter [Persicimonas caeni]|uniref:MFS transporter n=1 Tax=Persicimonas caeni TaxID=2292766 RepID=A0A4Y6PRA4_PERCE|nr:MFS transporter [Persicimonas caeni]QDG50753.1 MFS transporter [Persicimonas caeni]QED31974.1 MFS transporter [Persicimonas caeni]